MLAALWEQKSGEPADVLGPRFSGDETAALNRAIDVWREGSLDIQALCRRRGVAYLHVLQPTLHDRGSKPLTAPERKTGAAIGAWKRGVAYGYDRLRSEGARLLAAGLPFYDATKVFEQDERTLYYDACHFNKEGNVVLAERIAHAFRELALEPR